MQNDTRRDSNFNTIHFESFFQIKFGKWVLIYRSRVYLYREISVSAGIKESAIHRAKTHPRDAKDTKESGSRRYSQ